MALFAVAAGSVNHCAPCKKKDIITESVNHCAFEKKTLKQSGGYSFLISLDLND